MAVVSGNALPVIPPSESVRYKDETGNKAVDRSKYFLAQTPQTFKVSVIRQAFALAPHNRFTDDASVLEYSGTKINLVEGNRENIKITWLQDLQIAELWLDEFKV
jgi:2-C-methyl-D-erythritol 4-phosphate cytidylyltransferase